MGKSVGFGPREPSPLHLSPVSSLDSSPLVAVLLGFLSYQTRMIVPPISLGYQ